METLTIQQVARRLKVKPDTVRRWIRSGRMPGIKIGHILRVPEAELERYLASSTVAPAGLRISILGKGGTSERSVNDFLRDKHSETLEEEARWDERHSI